MLEPTKFEAICRRPEEVPQAALPFVRRELVDALGGDVTNYLPRFSAAFPRTAAILVRDWSKPMLVARKGVRRWVLQIALEQVSKNLIIDLAYEGDPVEGPQFDEEHRMLPPRWRELYRRIDSFVILSGSVAPLRWLNTPLGFASRFSPEDYCEFLGVPVSKSKTLLRTLKSDLVRAWLVTDSKEALFIDEQSNDGRVYHVQGDTFDDCCMLSEPSEALDAYLEHVVAGGVPSEFHFREYT